jgi:hypothetical protein
MSDAESAKPRIAETFIAAYFLSIFFTPTTLLQLAWQLRLFPRQWRLFVDGPFIALPCLGIICLVLGVNLLLQRSWSKTAAVFVSGLIVVALLVPFLGYLAPRGATLLPRPIYPWPLMVVHLTVNAAIVWYLARS